MTAQANVKERSSGMFIVLGFISAIVSLIIYPLFFGLLGVALGVLANKRGSRSGVSVIVLSIILGGIGLFYSGVIRTQLRLWLGM